MERRTIENPLSVRRLHAPIQTVLRLLAAQEGCDGHPYDQMMQAADYIDELELFVVGQFMDAAMRGDEVTYSRIQNINT